MKTFATVLAVFILMTHGVTAGEDFAKVARETSLKYQDCIVHVTATMKVEASGMGMMMGNGEEKKIETIGTVIDPSGLTVVSLSAMDPLSICDSMTIKNEDEDSQKITAASQFSDVKIRLGDGTEITSRLVMKEPDLDLAFVLPEKSGDTKYHCINLSDSGTLAVLDDIFILARYGKALNYKPSILKTYVTCIITKPRIMYAIDYSVSCGVPAFNSSGKLVGICTTKCSQDKNSEATDEEPEMEPVILTAADVQEAAKQALAKKEEPKQKDKKEEKK